MAAVSGVVGEVFDGVGKCVGLVPKDDKPKSNAYFWLKKAAMAAGAGITVASLIYGVGSIGPVPAVLIGALVAGGLTALVGVAIACMLEGGGAGGLMKCMFGDIQSIAMGAFSNVTGIPLDKIDREAKSVVKGTFKGLCNL